MEHIFEQVLYWFSHMGRVTCDRCHMFNR